MLRPYVAGNVADNEAEGQQNVVILTVGKLLRVKN